MSEIRQYSVSSVAITAFCLLLCLAVDEDFQKQVAWSEIFQFASGAAKSTGGQMFADVFN